MRRRRLILAFAMAAFIAMPHVHAQGLHRFELTIVVVSNLKPDDGIKEEVLKFSKDAPIAFNSLMDFWWEWGLDYCHDTIEREARRALRSEKRAA